MAGEETSDELARRLLRQYDPRTSRDPKLTDVEQTPGPFPTIDKMLSRYVINRDRPESATARAEKGAAEALYGIGRMPYDVGHAGAELGFNSAHGKPGAAALNLGELMLAAAPIPGMKGKPPAIRGYHGTDRQLKGGRFVESGPSGEGNFAHLDLDVPPDGVWFADAPNRAAYFAKAAERNRADLGDPGTGQNIIPADLHFKNPYTHPAEMMADEGISSLPPLDELRRLGHDGVVVPRAKWSSDYKSYGSPTHEEQILQARLEQASSERDRLAKEAGLTPGWYFADTTRVDWDPVARRVSELDGEAHDLYRQIRDLENARAKSEPGPLRLITDGNDYAAIAPDTVFSATTGSKLFGGAGIAGGLASLLNQYDKPE